MPLNRDRVYTGNARAGVNMAKVTLARDQSTSSFVCSGDCEEEEEEEEADEEEEALGADTAAVSAFDLTSSFSSSVTMSHSCFSGNELQKRSDSA